MPALSHTEEAQLIRDARRRSRRVGLHLTALLVGVPLLLALDFVGGHGPARGWSVLATLLWAANFGLRAVAYRQWRQERAEDLARARRRLLNRFAGTLDPDDGAHEAPSDPTFDRLVERCRAAAPAVIETLPALRTGVEQALRSLDSATHVAAEAHRELAGAGASSAETIARDLHRLDSRVAASNDPRLEALYQANRSRLVERQRLVAVADETRAELRAVAGALAAALEAVPPDQGVVSQALGAVRRAARDRAGSAAAGAGRSAG